VPVFGWAGQSRISASQCGTISSDLWAWVELNYRPHAYQAAS
jgi:hypothetical protein